MTDAVTGKTEPRERYLWIGRVPLDAHTLPSALDAIEALVAAGKGGTVFTPNLDHVVTAESDDRFASVYAGVDLSLADGQPLVWSARLLGRPLPAKVSGSDLTPRLLERAGQRGWTVYLLGGQDGVAAQLAEELPRTLGVRVVGAEGPRVSLHGAPGEEAIAQRVAASGAQLVLVALGAPKQELWIDRSRPLLPGAVCVGVGASLDFIAGRLTRAPRWMSDAGFEWLYRLGQEPRRLAYRYLVKDPAFAGILWREFRKRKQPR
jgi:N-acetylglucosaminyldiphosphoundecaprenol N-acetyl-beta-D-mannosaminyltransferase